VRKKKKERRKKTETTAAKYNGMPYWAAIITLTVTLTITVGIMDLWWVSTESRAPPQPRLSSRIWTIPVTQPDSD